MTLKSHLTSDTAACCWIPLFALRCETARRPELASLPVALLSPDDSRRVWQVAPLARRAGVKPGMTVSQAIGLCPEQTAWKGYTVRNSKSSKKYKCGVRSAECGISVKGRSPHELQTYIPHSAFRIPHFV